MENEKLEILNSILESYSNAAARNIVSKTPEAQLWNIDNMELISKMQAIQYAAQRNSKEPVDRIKALGESPEDIKSLADTVYDCITSNRNSDDPLVQAVIEVTGRDETKIMPVINAAIDSVTPEEIKEAELEEKYSKLNDNWLVGKFKNMLSLFHIPEGKVYCLNEEKKRAFKTSIKTTVAGVLAVAAIVAAVFTPLVVRNKEIKTDAIDNTSQVQDIGQRDFELSAGVAKLGEGIDIKGATVKETAPAIDFNNNFKPLPSQDDMSSPGSVVTNDTQIGAGETTVPEPEPAVSPQPVSADEAISDAEIKEEQIKQNTPIDNNIGEPLPPPVLVDVKPETLKELGFDPNVFWADSNIEIDGSLTFILETENKDNSISIEEGKEYLKRIYEYYSSDYEKISATFHNSKYEIETTDGKSFKTRGFGYTEIDELPPEEIDEYPPLPPIIGPSICEGYIDFEQLGLEPMPGLRLREQLISSDDSMGIYSNHKFTFTIEQTPDLEYQYGRQEIVKLMSDIYKAQDGQHLNGKQEVVVVFSNVSEYGLNTNISFDGQNWTVDGVETNIEEYIEANHDIGPVAPVIQPEEPWYVKHTFNGTPYEGVVKYTVDVPGVEPTGIPGIMLGPSTACYSVTTDREFTPDEIKTFEQFLKDINDKNDFSILNVRLIKEGETKPYYSESTIVADYVASMPFSKDITKDGRFVDFKGIVTMVDVVRADNPVKDAYEKDITVCDLTATIKGRTPEIPDLVNEIRAELDNIKSETGALQFLNEFNINVARNDGKIIGQITVKDNGNTIITSPEFENNYYLATIGPAIALDDVEDTEIVPPDGPVDNPSIEGDIDEFVDDYSEEIIDKQDPDIDKTTPLDDENSSLRDKQDPDIDESISYDDASSLKKDKTLDNIIDDFTKESKVIIPEELASNIGEDISEEH